MRYKTIIIVAILIMFSLQFCLAQNKKIELVDNDYKFKINIPDSWVKMKSEETKNHDGVSYVYNSKKDSTITFMIMAFKVPETKDINDFIYILEKDATLNIPQRNNEFIDFDFGKYDGKTAQYKDLQSTELIYYMRTKYEKAENNYVFMLRFITTNFNKKIETVFKDVANSFQVIE
jgi:hypothetical protein